MKHLLLVFILVLFSATTYGQGYHKLINESYYWDQTWAQMGYICGGFGETPPHRYYFSGDTLINNKLYAKMYSNVMTPTYFTPPPNCEPFDVDTVSELYSFYFLREDTIEKKVWRYWSYYDVEDLLYDFSLQQGDTLYDYYTYAVTIDTVYFITTDDGVTRKKFEIDQGYTIGYYIEGIGGIAGIFNQPLGYFEAGAWLMCVKDNNANIILDIGGHCYDFMTNAPIIKNNTQIKIFPNPFSKNIVIESSYEKLDISIYNIFGYEVITQELNMNNTINLSKLNSGIYFLRIIEDDKIIHSEKIIKTNEL